jgi:hypothetical protein
MLAEVSTFRVHLEQGNLLNLHPEKAHWMLVLLRCNTNFACFEIEATFKVRTYALHP